MNHFEFYILLSNIFIAVSLITENRTALILAIAWALLSIFAWRLDVLERKIERLRWGLLLDYLRGKK